MAGRFRFTPKCCCGVKEECTPPCIPECQEIFRGSLNFEVGLRDTIPQDPPYSSAYIQTNLLSTYNSISGDCSYFHITGEGNETHYAVPDTGRTYGNHRIGLVRYVVSGDITDCFGDIAISISKESKVYIENISSGDYTFPIYSYITIRSYDGLRHTPLSSNINARIHYRRIFCLPFDNKTEPICFTDNASVELRDVEDVEDYFVSINGDSRFACSFTWATHCGNGGNLAPTIYESAKGLKSRIVATAGYWQSPALDYQVIRLFGFTPPSEINAQLYTSTAVSAEFAVSYAQQSDGTIVPVVLGDISTDDFTLTALNFDDDYDKSGHPDYPEEILNYSGSASANARDARVVFGSADTNAFNAYNTNGSPNECPTFWQTSRETSLPHNAATLNSQRFNGIWWVFAARSPCGVPFPETVTHGILYSVPVGLFSFPTNAWSTSHRVRMTGVFTSAPLTLEKTNESMSYTELHQGVTRRNQYDSNFEYYIDVNWRGSDIGWTRPYIVKPVGKRLKRLIWRVFRNPLALIGTTIPPSSYRDIVTAQRIDCDTFSDLNSDPSNRPVPEKWTGYKVNVGGFNIVFPYPVNAAHYKPDQGDFAPTNQYTDSRGYVTNYAYDNGIIECEYSVNGDSFKTITPNDDPTGELTDTLYIPTLSRDKITQLFGGSLSGLKTISMGPDANFATDYFNSPILMATHFDFDYIAVWEDE